jgi:hypothetical protein
MGKGVVLMLSIFVLSTLFVGIVSASEISEIWSWLIGKNPDYSPFPEFAPFNVSVTIMQTNSPVINGLNNSIVVCEDSQLNYRFNVTDTNGDLNSALSYVDFHVFGSPLVSSLVFNAGYFPPSQTSPSGFLRASVRSGNLQEDQVGLYPLTISFRDIAGNVASQNFNITVVEINNILTFTEVVNQSVGTIGEGTVFSRQINADDQEDGSYLSQNLGFDLTIWNSTGGVVDLFDISSTGLMYYESDLSDLGTYSARVCVSDTGSTNVPSIFNYCTINQTGVFNIMGGVDIYNNGQPLMKCDDFTFVVTDENRAPVIDNYFNTSLKLNVSGVQEIYFNATAHDPDNNTLDFFWNVDGVENKFNGSVLFDDFRYQFLCDIGGLHNVSLRVSDGELNASLVWNITVQSVACPSAAGGGGGGGGGGSPRDVCEETWNCLEWNVCQNATASLELGVLSQQDFNPINETCANGSITGNCGFQLRVCSDLVACNTTFHLPDPIRQCYYTSDPSCEDGIENCHSGGCEFFVDCGGPCDACPTCSDGIENQGEQGLDCGGPCPFQCDAPAPINWNFLRYIIFGIAGIFSIIIIIKIVSIIRARRAINFTDYEQQNYNYEVNQNA